MRATREVTVVERVDRAETFEEFFERSRMPAARLAYLLTGSATTGHDVAQEALTAVHRRWAEIDNPSAYLRTVVVNLSRGLQRRWIRERAALRRLRTQAVTSNPDFDDTWRAVLRLPPRPRAIVVLRFYEDLSLAQIGEVLDLPEGTVKSALHRALRQLKELL